MLSEKKIYTLEEANAIVPLLLRDMPVLQKLKAMLDSSFPDIHKAQENARFNGGSVEGAEYLRVVLQYTKLSHALQSQGCILKGIEQGLVDFPSIHKGREVYLCWKFPEKEIRHWHDIDAGFSGRQAI